MTYTLILHISNTEPIVGEVDELPTSSDTLIAIKHPRMRDGKDVPYIDPNAISVLWPVHQLRFIEILTGMEEEEIIGFVRE